jgi:P-type Ca2+ transporter type 2C
VTLVAATLGPVLLGLPVPFSPVQIILLELFMDVGAASTFVAERAESDLMRRPPRDARAPFINGAMGCSIVLAAAGLFAAVAAAYLVTLYGGGDVARVTRRRDRHTYPCEPPGACRWP